ncbi:hypothetical protein LSH36_14g08036 [Paralvinella palmiformis]|uniref:Uncharacterized protein n=1 Tax=Paralvinella palmiformis TaxID=53620 RepID=A0AAD9KCU2_9ANNE|nr:hypothetical protein LSH36_14g08036 [Paralvinella palmiformis]
MDIGLSLYLRHRDIIPGEAHLDGRRYCSPVFFTPLLASGSTCMKIALILVVVCLTAAVSAGYYDGYGGYRYGGGLQPVYGGVAAPYRNDLRQVYVNHEAEYVGAGTGTARHYGVPGTGNNFGYGYGYYGH